MKLREPIHPFTLPFVAAIVAAIVWPLHHFWGIGDQLFEYAVGASGLFVFWIIVTFAVAGIGWVVVRLVNRKSTGRSDVVRIDQLRRKPPEK